MTLQLRRLTRDFPVAGGARHRAVDDLSLDIEPGTFCTLLGPSGCGKTTLLRMVAGFEEPTSGDILHEGRSLAGVLPYRRGFPMVFQSYALFPHMTVEENVAYGLRVRRLPAGERNERVQRALALLGLESQRGKHPAQLSGGQQQRVALARCLVLEPSIILLDEPLSNLDAGLRVEMRREIRALQQRLGITAIYVTHDQEEALAVSDRIIVMNRGRVEQDGTPADIYQRPDTAFVARFMGCSNVVPAERVAANRVRLLGEEYELPAGEIPPVQAGQDMSPPAGQGATTAAGQRAPTVPVGAIASAVVRDDAIRFRNAGRHRGRIVETTFLGARIQYVIELPDGSSVTADEPASAGKPLRSGEDVAFDVSIDRVHFIVR
jgi:iron(III) transport system ATP-binding protein